MKSPAELALLYHRKMKDRVEQKQAEMSDDEAPEYDEDECVSLMEDFAHADMKKDFSAMAEIMKAFVKECLEEREPAEEEE